MEQVEVTTSSLALGVWKAPHDVHDATMYDELAALCLLSPFMNAVPAPARNFRFAGDGRS